MASGDGWGTLVVWVERDMVMNGRHIILSDTVDRSG